MVYALGREEDAGESRDQDGPEVVRRGAPAAVDSRFQAGMTNKRTSACPPASRTHPVQSASV